MARFQYVVFRKVDGELHERKLSITDDLSQIQGFIIESEVFSLDTLRWMLPEVSEETRRETFRKILMRKLQEANEQGLIATVETFDF